MQATARGPARQKPASNGMAAAAIALLAKGKVILLSLAKLKYFYTIISAVISVFAYAGRFGWAGAVGFVALLFVHEMGHVIALKRQGVPASLPLFIPFVGALIGMKAYPKGVVDEAWSAIAGPLLGSAGALVCLGIYFATGQQLYAWLAYIGIFLNLFNLLPMSPLDGGRVIGAIWRGFWLLGVVAAVALALFLGSPILLLFAVFGLDEINRRYMPVHWSAYLILGVAAVAGSFVNGEIFWGGLVAFFAYVHAKRAKSARRAEELKSMMPRVFRVAFAVPNSGVTSFQTASAEPSQLLYFLRNSQRHTFHIVDDAGVTKYEPQNDLRFTIKRAPHHMWFHKSGSDKPRNCTRYMKRPVNGSSDAYFMVPKKQRFILGSLYVGLASVLTGILCWMHAAGLFNRPH